MRKKEQVDLEVLDEIKVTSHCTKNIKFGHIVYIFTTFRVYGCDIDKQRDTESYCHFLLIREANPSRYHSCVIKANGMCLH